MDTQTAARFARLYLDQMAMNGDFDGYTILEAAIEGTLVVQRFANGELTAADIKPL